MNVLLVDDEKLQLIRLENEAKKAFSEPVTFLAFTNPLLALKECEEKRIDIAFLDIEMPGINGIGLAKELKKKNPAVNLIFVTAYDDYALDALRLHASGYLSKPVSAIKIQEELEALRHPFVWKGEHPLQIKCFGNFELFYEGKPLRFAYRKSKEAFAYLVDREGSAISLGELNAILWEEDHASYLRNLIVDIQHTLKEVGCEGVFLKNRNGYAIDVHQVDCDAYEYKKGNPAAIRLYRGEYMAQYPWAIFQI